MIKSFNQLLKELQTSDDIVFDGVIIKSAVIMKWTVDEAVKALNEGKFSIVNNALCVGDRTSNCKGYDICRNRFCDDISMMN